MSLREALKLIAGKSQKKEQTFAHEGITRDGAASAIEAMQRIIGIIDDEVTVILAVEGVTRQHTAMKDVIKIRAAMSHTAQLAGVANRQA